MNLEQCLTKLQQILTTIQNNRPLFLICESAAVILLSLIVIAVGNKILDVIFNEERKKTESEKRRIDTLNRTSKMVLKVAVVIFAILDISSFFIDIKAILTVAGVGTLAIGIGAQSIVTDVLSGFLILAENLYSVGEYIQLDGDHYGKVEKIGLRMTHIRQIDRSLFIIHNGEITRLTNFSKGSVRASVKVAVAFEEKIEKVYQVLEDLFEEIVREGCEGYLNKPEVMGVEKLAESGVEILIEADVKADYERMVERDLRRRIKECFDAHQIEIPYNKFVILNDNSK